jgi:hypothetical protein
VTAWPPSTAYAINRETKVEQVLGHCRPPVKLAMRKTVAG